MSSSENDLNSRAFPLGSLMNMVLCSPGEFLNLVFGFIVKLLVILESIVNTLWYSFTQTIKPKK